MSLSGIRTKAVIVLVVGALLAMWALPASAASTAVPGFQKDRYDEDNNGITDAGVFVTGHCTSV